MKIPQAHANVIGRIAAVGTAYGIDVDALLERLTPLAPQLADFLLVTIPHTFDRIAVATRVAPGDDALARVRDICGSELGAIAAQLAGPELRYFGVELETRASAPLAVALHAFGARNLDSDLARLAALGVGESVRATLNATATRLGADRHLIALSSRSYDDTRSWVLRIAQPNHDDIERAATRERIAAAAVQLGVTGAQRRMVEAVHDTFAKERDTHITLRAGNDGLERELGVIWARVAWPQILRMMLGFYPNTDPGPRLGELAGAFDGEHAASVELVLGPSEPPGMRIAAVLRGGRVPS